MELTKAQTLDLNAHLGYLAAEWFEDESDLEMLADATELITFIAERHEDEVAVLILRAGYEALVLWAHDHKTDEELSAFLVLLFAQKGTINVR